MGDQIADPLGVLDVGLAARDGFHVLGVQQPRLDPVGGLQQVVQGLPAGAGGLHAHDGDPQLQQPVPQHKQVLRHRREGADLTVGSTAASRHAHGHFAVGLAEVGSRAPLVQHVHASRPLLPLACSCRGKPPSRANRLRRRSLTCSRQQFRTPESGPCVRLPCGLHWHQAVTTSAGRSPETDFPAIRAALEDPGRLPWLPGRSAGPAPTARPHICRPSPLCRCAAGPGPGLGQTA